VFALQQNIFFLKEIKLDMKEKLLRQEAKEAQILSEKRLTKENLTEQLKLTEETGRREIEKLKMQYAIDHSNSTVAELNGKLKSSELMIERLNQIIGESKGDREKLSRVQVSFEFLSLMFCYPIKHLKMIIIISLTSYNSL